MRSSSPAPKKIPTSRWAVLSLLLTVTCAVTLPACDAFELPRSRGAECSLTSDCDSPLVCSFGTCRKECSTWRDCSIGLDCIIEQTGIGVCQLDEETSCSLTSECADGLSCVMGECSNPCACDPGQPCADCSPGAVCVEASGGVRACVDLAVESCTLNSDCPGEDSSFTCPDGRCRNECRTDADCRNSGVCLPSTFSESTTTGPVTLVSGNLCFSEAGRPPRDGGADSPSP